MNRRYASVWLYQLLPDRMILRQPELRDRPFVVAAPAHGRLLVTAANPIAMAQGVYRGMGVADAKAFLPQLEVLDDRPGLGDKLLEAIGLWSLRYTPSVSVDAPEGLLLDITGCTHLWGGELAYAQDLLHKLEGRYGFHARIGIADTIGAAWAFARYGSRNIIVTESHQLQAELNKLPPEALRLESIVTERLYKLGLHTIGSFSSMPAGVLKRRFGTSLVQRIRQAWGEEEEYLFSLKPMSAYTERLPCMEPVRTVEAIEMSILRLLEALCKRLRGEGNGVRAAVLQGYRVDGKTVQVTISTSRATAHLTHLLKLFTLKIPEIEPDLGIELWVLEATRVEKVDAMQEAFWEEATGLEDPQLAELIDRLTSRNGTLGVHRFLPNQHHWPERSIRPAITLEEKATVNWSSDRPRPIRLLPKPERIDVTAPIPDYPPMVFRYKGEAHLIKRADGPERIEREWWMDEGEHRDYYAVEDEQGRRYWIFRSGYYEDEHSAQWFLHGFFA